MTTVTQADREAVLNEFNRLAADVRALEDSLAQANSRLQRCRRELWDTQAAPGCTHKRSDGTDAWETSFAGEWCPLCGVSR